jgi:hypothetical protein
MSPDFDVINVKQKTSNQHQSMQATKHISFKNMTIYMTTILDKEKPDKENIRSLNLAVVRPTTIQVNKLLLQPELLFIGHICCTKDGLKEA